jgi:hypothetical protein
MARLKLPGNLAGRNCHRARKAQKLEPWQALAQVRPAREVSGRPRHRAIALPF